jgi:hypothetical protein
MGTKRALHTHIHANKLVVTHAHTVLRSTRDIRDTHQIYLRSTRDRRSPVSAVRTDAKPLRVRVVYVCAKDTIYAFIAHRNARSALHVESSPLPQIRSEDKG